MKAKRPTVPEVGQRWAMPATGYLYEVTSLDSGDVQYPIVLREVFREPEVNRQLRAKAEQMGWTEEYLARFLAPHTMNVDRRWVEFRTDAEFIGKVKR